MLKFPQNNSSAWCANDCYFDKICGPSKWTTYNICICQPYYDPMSKCEKSFFDVFRREAMIYTSLGTIGFGLFFLLFAIEIITDLRLKQFHFPLLPKTSLLLFTIFRLTHFGLWFNQMLNDPVSNLSTIDTVLRTLGVVLLGSLGYLSVCIAWCDLILKAKKLGTQSKRVRILRIILIITCSCVTPITMTINIYTSFSNSTKILTSIGNAVGGVAILISLSITTYLLVMVYRWLQIMSKEEFHSNRITLVKKRTRWLIGMNVMLCLTFIMVVTFTNLPDELPYIYLIIQSITRIVELMALTCLYGFVQTYMMIYKGIPLVGYFYGIIRHPSIMNLLSKTPSVNTPNISHTNTSSTTSK